ncbi:MAG TPA: hypothetical protein VFL93_03115 [Longimicrobiaceae bacterium]|nr:hypothetical protein [Longimicrobiaceae bacterium]
MLDIRLPIGGLFTVLGALLTVWGAIEPASTYANSLGYNVNLSWGIILLIFGLLMLFFGRRGTSRARLAQDTAQGRAIEEIEYRTGEESTNPVVRDEQRHRE